MSSMGSLEEGNWYLNCEMKEESGSIRDGRYKLEVLEVMVDLFRCKTVREQTYKYSKVSGSHRNLLRHDRG